MKRNRMLYGAGAVVLAAGVVAAATLDRNGAGTPASTREYAVVERIDMEIVAEAAGHVEPIRVVEVKSKASGDVLQLNADLGDRVERGALLATIDPRDVRNAFAQAQADLDVARARLATAEAQKRRVEELLRANVVTDQEYEGAQLEEANARAQYVKARTSLELAQERLADVTIRAPIDGTIISRQVEVGTIIASASQNISGGTTLFMMADLAEMQVRALIDETDLGRVHEGQQVRVRVESYPDRVFRGTVTKIEPQAVVDQNVTMFPVLIHLDNRDGMLRPGMNADVAIEIAQRPGALTVPNAAVIGIRDAIPAGAVLGFSEEQMQEKLRAGMPDRAAAGARNGPAGSTGTPAAGASRRQGGGGGDPAVMAATRERMAAQAGAGAGPGAATSSSRDVRPGIVFVAGPDGPEPRRVMLGLNDWDRSEIVSGLEEGDRVVLISVARLQQQQEEFARRMRERMGGGPFPGAGGR